MSKFGENPYVGAQPLTAKNPLFGRDREVRDLFFLLCKERIVLMYAPSGAGKSSLLEGRGGLLDAMYERFHVWPVTRVNTEPSVPCRNRYVLSALLGFERAAPPEHMRSEDQLAGLTLREGVMGRWRHPDDQNIILLVFDQFEEIVRLNPTDVDQQREFFHQLGELLAEPTVWALLVMREDYLAAIDPYIRQVPTHFRNRFRLDLLTRGAAAEAIAKTAETAGRYWEDAAVKRIVNDLALVKIQPMHGAPYVVPGQYVEPLQLQVVCRDLWDKLAPDDVSFGADDMEKIGNVDLALANYYRRCVREISDGNVGVERAIRNWISKELILPGFVRGQVLRGQFESGGLKNSLVDALVAKHVVRAEKRSGSTWYELAHDRLMPAVDGCNRIWFSRNLSALERWAELWVTQARNPDLLQTGGDLRALRKWAKHNPDRVHDNERAFLSLSGREDGKLWKRRGLVAAVLFLFLTAALFMFVAGDQSNQADRNAAVHYGVRADELVSRKEWAVSWLYTLGSLNKGWQASDLHPDGFGRLLQFEIHPRRDWRARARVALGSVARRDPMDRILHVSTKSNSVNHSAAILQRHTETGFEVYRTSPDDRGSASTNLLFSYKYNEPGAFGEMSTGGLFCVEVAGKFYFAGGDQLVEQGALLKPPQGRRLATGDSPVIALRSTTRGIGVLTEDGRLRFVNASSMAWERKEWNLSTEGLAGFDVVGDDLAVAYGAVGATDGRISVWKLGAVPVLLPSVTGSSTGGASNRVVSIVEQNPLIVAYGTQHGEVGLIHFSGDNPGQVVAKNTPGRSAVIQLAGSSENGGDLVSVSEDGSVRHLQMRIRPLGGSEEHFIWKLAIDPSSTATQDLFSKLQEQSLDTLHHGWEGSRLQLNNRPKFEAALREWYDRNLLFQYKRFAESELIRASDGNWTWKNAAGQAALREKRRDQSSVVLDESGHEIRVPLRPGGWVTLNGNEFTRVENVTPDRIGLSKGYLLDVGANRWQFGSGGDRSPRVLKLQSSMPNGESILTAGENAASYLVPRGDGPLRFRADPVAEPAPIGPTVVTQVNYISDPLDSEFSPHRIQYISVGVNGGPNTVRVKPGQVVSMRAQWSVSAGEDKSKQQQFLLGMATPEGGFSRCVATFGGDRQAGLHKSGYVQLELRAPTKPGWYFLTHATQAGTKCVADPALHATGPENAVAAFFVEDSSDDAGAR